ncbi:hypothetical protein FALCPG4_003996 [Fusarium falciforme]
MPWEPKIIGSEILAIHIALMPSGPEGEVLLLGGDEHWSKQTEPPEGNGEFRKTRVFDVASSQLVGQDISSPDSDVFCAGHSFVADGRLLIVGGTKAFVAGGAHQHALAFWGHRRNWLYHPRLREWREAAPLQFSPLSASGDSGGGRWYPGTVTLGDGDVMAFFGHVDASDTRHRNTRAERFSVYTNAWRYLRDMANPSPAYKPGMDGVRFLMYARNFLMPDGRIFFATPMPYQWEANKDLPNISDGEHRSVFYDPSTGEYGEAIDPEPLPYTQWSFPCVLLPLLPSENYRPRVLHCGASRALRVDLGSDSPRWEAVTPTALGINRLNSCAVILPTGQVCLVGGVQIEGPDDQDEVVSAELYDPSIDWAAGEYTGNLGSWTVPAGDQPPKISRNYHSAALLLPNGKVFTCGGNKDAAPGGGDPDKVGVKKIEIYHPPYPSGTRPTISQAPKSVTYGHSFQVVVSNPESVGRVALLRNGSCTHAYDFDQRYVGVEFNHVPGNNYITVAAPPNGNIAPPGYYMLWVVDAAGRPCEMAKFIRLAHRSCFVITDRSTFSDEEVEATGKGGAADFLDAIYVVYDGFIDTEIQDTPTIEAVWADDQQSPVSASHFTLTSAPRLQEESPGNPDVPQRITFPFHVRFPSNAVFGTFQDTRWILLTFRLGQHVCRQTIGLTHSPNPYMIDINPATRNPAWLSTDVRVFCIEAGQTKFDDVVQGTDNPIQFIRHCLDKLNASGGPGNFYFEGLDTEAPLDIASLGPSGRPIFNYAISRVRYRALTTTAQWVKCFFRSFNVATTGLDFRPDFTYRSSGPPDSAVPLLGISGDEVVSIPFFASPRVETVEGMAGATSMDNQTLTAPYEIRNIVPSSSGSEVEVFFGAWLDINRPAERRFPFAPSASARDGPYLFDSAVPIQSHIRSRHQCLVAEIFYEQDPTMEGKGPASSDNLAQRNLAILHADNPGDEASNTVVHPLEITPPFSWRQDTDKPELTVGPAGPALALRSPRDELLIRWHNVPQASTVTLTFAQPVTISFLIHLASYRASPLACTIVDESTISFHVPDSDGMTYIPVPDFKGNAPIPALLSMTIPAGAAVAGRRYHLTVHQTRPTGHRRELVKQGVIESAEVVGSAEVSLRVSRRPIILQEETRTLSVFKHIATTIPRDNRWWELMQRYVGYLGEKVDALGGDSRRVHGNPDGSGQPGGGVGDDGCNCCGDVLGDEKDCNYESDSSGSGRTRKSEIWVGRVCAVHYNHQGNFVNITGKTCRGGEKIMLGPLSPKFEKTLLDAAANGRTVRMTLLKRHRESDVRQLSICYCK